ncbi:MAG: EAL domain-containing protein, partial [Pseudomonadota bacterium]
LITDADGRILEANPAFSAMTGYTLDEVRGRDPGLLASGLHDAVFYRHLWKQLHEHGSWSGEIWNRRKNGEMYPEWKVIQTMRDSQGNVLNYCSHGIDMSLEQAQKKQLERLTQFDALTGLPNRQQLHQLLETAMADSTRTGANLAVVCLDLDDFKAVNEAHGPVMGDRLLMAFAQRLKATLRPGDVLARLGGDEFVLVLGSLSERAAVRQPLERLLNACSCSVSELGTEVALTASYGVTFYPQALAVDADQLLRQAQQALFEAKQGGKNRAQMFDAEQDQALRQRNLTLERLKLALQRGEFVLHYQPKVHLRSGAVLGVEALVRWQHPERGLLPPGVFLPALEGQGLMVELGHWVIDAALAQIECWRAAGLHLPVSVNVDALQLAQSDFVARLQAALDRHPSVPPSDLEIEILETSALGDLRQVCALLRACQDLGVQASLDDFGTGYSSLTHFKHLPVQTIKIDQSFVRDLLDNADNVPILRSVLDLAAAFGRLAIAEGVETLAHGELLLRLGCEHGQGYAIAKPMPARQVRDWVAQWQAPAAWASAPGQSAAN